MYLVLGVTGVKRNDDGVSLANMTNDRSQSGRGKDLQYIVGMMMSTYHNNASDVRKPFPWQYPRPY